jgi:hypothetical protein
MDTGMETDIGMGMGIGSTVAIVGAIGATLIQTRRIFFASAPASHFGPRLETTEGGSAGVSMDH